jgi:hypothetical protein
MKRLITILPMLVLLCGLSFPAFAQDPPADPPATTETAPAPDTTPAPDPKPEDKPKADAPEKENGDAEPDASNPPAADEPAKDDAKQTALSKLSEELMNILIPAFVTLIGLLVTFILNWVRRKFKLNVSDAQIASWAVLAEKAANRGAEWARNKAKDLTDDKTVPGPEILEVAVDWAVEMGKSLKLPEMGREKLIGLIEGHLATKRADPDDPMPA